MLRAEAGGQGLMDSRRRYAQPLLVLMGCAALVLLIACVNIAGLLLSRGAARQKEIATRLALGAAGGRIVSQLGAESLLIAGLGAAVGLVLARWAASVLVVWRPWGGSAVLDGGLDWRVFGFCGAMTLCTGVLFGLTPAMRAARTKLNEATKRTTGMASSLLARALGRGAGRPLADAAGDGGPLRRHAQEFIRRGQGLQRRPLVDLPRPAAAERLCANRECRTVRAHDRAPRGHSGRAGRDGVTPSTPRTQSPRRQREYRRRRDNCRRQRRGERRGGKLFDTMEIPLLLGRDFDERDRAGSTSVAVVNERFAATYLAGASPIGRRLWFGDAGSGNPIEIVGMTRDAKYTDLRSATKPTVYVPFQQDIPGQVNVAVRTAGEAMVLAPAVRSAVRELDATLPLFDVRSQAEQIGESIARETMFARFSTLLAVIAMVLAAVGLYGTMAYTVAQRTAEIGLRMALGARRADVIGMVVRQTLVVAAIGVAIGVPLTLGAGRLAGTVLDQMLFGLGRYDPVVMGGAAAILALVAIVASLDAGARRGPGRSPSRASPRVDAHPASAVRR